MSQSQRGRARFLRGVEILKSLQEAELEELELTGRELSLKKKSSLWEPGDHPDRVYVVRSGVVKVQKPVDKARDITVDFYTRGQIVGEDALYVESGRQTRAEAYDDTVLIALPRQELARLMRRNGAFGSAVAVEIGRRRARMEDRLQNLLFRTADARLAGLFLDLAQDFGVRDSRGVIVNLKLTHKEMAALIGATRETVSFAVLDLRKNGLILTEGRRVILLDEGGLEALRDG